MPVHFAYAVTRRFVRALNDDLDVEASSHGCVRSVPTSFYDTFSRVPTSSRPVFDANEQVSESLRLAQLKPLENASFLFVRVGFRRLALADTLISPEGTKPAATFGTHLRRPIFRCFRFENGITGSERGFGGVGFGTSGGDIGSRLHVAGALLPSRSLARTPSKSDYKWSRAKRLASKNCTPIVPLAATRIRRAVRAGNI